MELLARKETIKNRIDEIDEEEKLSSIEYILDSGNERIFSKKEVIELKKRSKEIDNDEFFTEEEMNVLQSK